MVPDSRSKTEVSDLGELIVLANLILACPPIDKATPITWQLLNGPFLEEAITRNVRWVLADHSELEVPEEERITFLNVFFKAYARNLKRLNDNYGFSEPEIPEKMVKEVKAIYGVPNWSGFFHRARYEKGLAFGAERMSELLRGAVRKSAQKGCHTPTKQRDLHVLATNRDYGEKMGRKEDMNILI
ncbi:hypothetical protein C0991_010299 [Blastosporella zonata]|nr:hypothetical protein C0991_010299 [Blastosporella zonata]